ncbi:MAG: EAL domain-containing protein [Undibacterium sp.]|nr:EAL domain-containing protein [Undibacterium sp.]
MNFKKGWLNFFRRFWLTLGVFLIFSIVFAIYVRSEKQIDRAYDLRIQSQALADELRQSSDDLTRMVRTYVTTGNRAYKQYYQEIIDIRDGKLARPLEYQGIYWDLVLAEGARPRGESGRAVALLDLMREVGFTQEEYAKLAQAKANSDALTKIEIDAMKLVESTTQVGDANRNLASKILNDANYHNAKAAIMRPISEFYQLMDTRTLDEVSDAKHFALQLRIAFILFGFTLVVMLWRAYQALYAMLGGDADDLQTRLARLGLGDFSSPITVPAGLDHSMMGWLAVTQEKLAGVDAERKRAVERGERLTQLYNALSQCNQAIVRSTNQAELFDKICSDTVSFGGMKMAWIGLIDPQTKLLSPVAAFGDGLDYLQDRIISMDGDSQLGKGPSGIAAREDRPYWCQDFQHHTVTTPWHAFGVMYGWAASAALPLHRNGVVIGSFNLYASAVDFFDEEVRNLLLEMAMDIDFALNRFDLEIERQRSQKMEALRVFMLERISSTMPLNKIFLDVVRNLETIIPGCVCTILLLDQDGRHMRIGAAPGLPDFYNDAISGLSVGEGIGSCGNTMHTGMRTIVENIATHPYWAQFKGLAEQAGLSSCWSEPIQSSNRKILGSFAIYQRTVSVPDRIHIQLLEMAAHFIAIAIERKQSEISLRKLSQAVEQSPNVIIITDTDANIEYVNAAFEKVNGKKLSEVVGTKSSFLQSGKTEHFTFDEMWTYLKQGESWRGELLDIHEDGSEHVDLVLISPVRDEAGVVTHYLSIQEDITEKKRAEERIQYLAHYDALTGLPNRALFDERAKYALSLAKRNQQSLAVIFLNLDHFKDINDSLGHNLGDAILIEVAKRLLFAVRENDIVSRLGGDEFILLLPGDDDLGTETVLQKLVQIISHPYQIGQLELNVTASMGIAIYPEDGTDLEALSRNADVAMYRTKLEGRNGYRFFTREMQARSVHHLELLNALRHAVERNQLQVVYQPQVSILSGQVVGAEALLRWQHPQLGAISPAEFIPIAEESGLILPIGEWVLRTAVQQVKAWHDQGLTSLTVAVNLSAVQFRHRDLPDLVTRILDEAGLASRYLELELTEGVAMFDPQGAIAVMNNLHERGVRMSIDDFGTGYSSLNYLKKFKVYKLKIDQSFVRDISSDPEDKAIVGAVIGIAKSLGLQTIAEGVETAEQLEFLREQGCDEIQGYYFSKPLPAMQFQAFLSERRETV